MLLWQIYLAENIKTYLGLYVPFPIFLSDFNQICSFWTDFHAGPQSQIHAINFSVSRPNTCTETDRQMDNWTLIGAFRDDAQALNL